MEKNVNIHKDSKEMNKAKSISTRSVELRLTQLLEVMVAMVFVVAVPCHR
jgi:hypothetical protein